MIHIGLNTVELDGKYFTAFVEKGEKIKKGQKLIEFDQKAIKEAGYVLETPIIVTNSGDYKEISVTCRNEIKRGESILKVNR